jgi:hypothetical protein
MHRRFAAAIALVFAAGCASGPGEAQVSGRVTLDGQPLAEARVEFQPIGSKENPNPGVGSYGVTDADGRYSLMLFSSPPRPGAVVANHRVAIRAKANQGDRSDDRRASAGDAVPAKYNDKTELTFEVKPGPNQADFGLTSK